MSQNLGPKRKFAYIFDRRHFGMIGTVTQRDPNLEWVMNVPWGLNEEGENRSRGHKTSKEGFSQVSGIKGMTGPPGQASLPHGRSLFSALLMCRSLM